MSEGEKLIPINIEDEMKSAYDYSMSVIVSRADVRDGLKPVHRRVLYGMYDLGVFSNKAQKIRQNCGEVLGKYHPMEIHLFMTYGSYGSGMEYALSTS
jgi:DNA gyrase subunit A